MSDPIVELRDLTIRRDGRTILDVARLAVERTSVLAVLGRNGAGKSTLLRAIGGLVEPTVGSILLHGRPSTAAERRRLIAAVLQRPLLRRGSVRSNVEAGLRFRGAAADVRRTQAEHWIRRLGLSHLVEQPAHRLSAGEAQRVSVARALALESDLLLLDEPFAALDTPTRSELLADLATLVRAARRTVLFVTHDRHEASILADRIAILHQGRLLQHGPVRDVYDDPADAVTAELLGYQNQLPAASLPPHLPQHGAVLLARPADVRIAPEPRTPWDVPAVAVRPTIDGDAPSYIARVGEREVIARLGDAPVPSAGAAIAVRFDPPRLRWCGTPGDDSPGGWRASAPATRPFRSGESHVDP